MTNYLESGAEKNHPAFSLYKEICASLDEKKLKPSEEFSALVGAIHYIRPGLTGYSIAEIAEKTKELLYKWEAKG